MEVVMIMNDITILNRMIRWAGDTIRYEAYSKHVEEILKYFGLGDESKGLEMLAAKEIKEEAADRSQPLSKEVLTEFAAEQQWRIMYLKADPIFSLL